MGGIFGKEPMKILLLNIAVASSYNTMNSSNIFRVIIIDKLHESGHQLSNIFKAASFKNHPVPVSLALDWYL